MKDLDLMIAALVVTLAGLAVSSSATSHDPRMWCVMQPPDPPAADAGQTTGMGLPPTCDLADNSPTWVLRCEEYPPAAYPVVACVTSYSPITVLMPRATK